MVRAGFPALALGASRYGWGLPCGAGCFAAFPSTSRRFAGCVVKSTSRCFSGWFVRQEARSASDGNAVGQCGRPVRSARWPRKIFVRAVTASGNDLPADARRDVVLGIDWGSGLVSTQPALTCKSFTADCAALAEPARAFCYRLEQPRDGRLLSLRCRQSRSVSVAMSCSCCLRTPTCGPRKCGPRS